MEQIALKSRGGTSIGDAKIVMRCSGRAPGPPPPASKAGKGRTKHKEHATDSCARQSKVEGSRRAATTIWSHRASK